MPDFVYFYPRRDMIMIIWCRKGGMPFLSNQEEGVVSRQP